MSSHECIAMSASGWNPWFALAPFEELQEALQACQPWGNVALQNTHGSWAH